MEQTPSDRVLGLVGGIGLTMALFIAQLAFPRGALLETDKLGILAASGTAAIAAFVAGQFLLPSNRASAAAPTRPISHVL